jgi:hypothetical protein
VQTHNDRGIFQTLPGELSIIDIHSLQPVSDARRRSTGDGRLGRGLRRRDKNATELGARRVGKPPPDARSRCFRGSRVAHQQADRSGVPLTGLSLAASHLRDRRRGGPPRDQGVAAVDHREPSGGDDPGSARRAHGSTRHDRRDASREGADAPGGRRRGSDHAARVPRGDG